MEKSLWCRNRVPYHNKNVVWQIQKPCLYSHFVADCPHFESNCGHNALFYGIIKFYFKIEKVMPMRPLGSLKFFGRTFKISSSLKTTTYGSWYFSEKCPRSCQNLHIAIQNIIWVGQYPRNVDCWQELLSHTNLHGKPLFNCEGNNDDWGKKWVNHCRITMMKNNHFWVWAF